MWPQANHLSRIVALPLIQSGSPVRLCILPQLLREQHRLPTGCQCGSGGTGQKLQAHCLLHADTVPTCRALPSPRRCSRCSRCSRCNVHSHKIISLNFGAQRKLGVFPRKDKL